MNIRSRSRVRASAWIGAVEAAAATAEAAAGDSRRAPTSSPADRAECFPRASCVGTEDAAAALADPARGSKPAEDAAAAPEWPRDSEPPRCFLPCESFGVTGGSLSGESETAELAAASDARLRPLTEDDAEGEGEGRGSAASCIAEQPPSTADEAACERPREVEASLTLDDAAAAAAGVVVASLSDEADMDRLERR